MILDTNALSALVGGDESLLPILRRSPVLSLPAVVLGEYRYGILQSRHRREYELWLKEELPTFRLLQVGHDTAYFYANIRLKLKKRGRLIPVNDTWIAALALEYELPVASRDKHFDEVENLQRISW